MKGKAPNIEWLAILTALCWGTGSFFGKRAMKIGQISPLTGITLRTFIAMIFFFIFLGIFGKRMKLNFLTGLKAAWKKSKIGFLQIIFFEGFLAGGLGMFLYYLAISGGELSIVMPLAFLSPLWGTILALIFQEENLTFHRTFGMIFSITGIIILASIGISFSDLFFWRIEYVALLTGICWGIGSYFGKKGMKKTDINSISGITIRSSISFAILILFSITLGPIALDSYLFQEIVWSLINEPMQFVFIVIFEGLLAGFLGMLVYYIAIRKGELSLVMPIAFTSPFWGTLWGIVFQTEILTTINLSGMLFILYGIVLTSAPDFLQPIIVKKSDFLIKIKEE